MMEPPFKAHPGSHKPTSNTVPGEEYPRRGMVGEWKQLPAKNFIIPPARRPPMKQGCQMVDTRMAHNENAQLCLAQESHRESSERTGFIEEQPATALGREWISKSPPRRGVAHVGVTDVDKTRAMLDLRFH